MNPLPPVLGGWPDGLQAMLAVDIACDAQGLSLRLLELVRLHCSVLNGCAFCIAMHTEKTLKLGLAPTLVDDIVARRGPGGLGEGERTALAYAAALTRLDQNDQATIAGATSALRQYFGPKDVIVLTYAVAQINAWNRLARADPASR
jgi:AhpD family alkylhydroperoxidase